MDTKQKFPLFIGKFSTAGKFIKTHCLLFIAIILIICAPFAGCKLECGYILSFVLIVLSIAIFHCYFTQRKINQLIDKLNKKD